MSRMIGMGAEVAPKEDEKVTNLKKENKKLKSDLAQALKDFETVKTQNEEFVKEIEALKTKEK